MSSKQINGSSRTPATYFASPDRATEQEFQESVRRISNNSLANFALEMLGGWIAVLNEHRQVLAVNHSLLVALGLEDPAGMLGMRPGEMLRCIHAKDHPAGCGTSRYCSSCGAAIAIVASQQTGQAQERECVVTIEREGSPVDHIFLVRCCPFQMEGRRLLLVSMNDVSDENYRRALERTFLHDLGNTLLGLSLGVKRLGGDDAEMLSHVRRAVSVLVRELRVQRILTREGGRAHLEPESIRPSELLSELKDLMSTHSASRGQELEFQQAGDDEPWETDVGLLMRVLTNMVVNALEAGEPGDQVRVRAEVNAHDVVFHVWNRRVIPEAVSWRVFQRHFTTKAGGGRGLGTFTIKLLGETLLGGTVGFTSTAAGGTTFRIRLPRRWSTSK